MNPSGAPSVMSVAVLQLSAGDRLSANLERMEQVADEAAHAGAEVLVLPEGFAYMGPESGKRPLAETIPDPQAPIQQALTGLVRRHQVTVVAGGFPETTRDPARPHNTCLVLDPTGELARYRKIHLFDVIVGERGFRESEATAPGDRAVVCTISGFTTGLSICYDLRFPELYRELVGAGAEVIAVPSAFTAVTGRDHWHVLLRTRAIETQCYVLAAAQWGTHPGERQTFGHALIADPWGTILVEAPEGEGFVSAKLDKGLIGEVRRKMPLARHRPA